MSEAIECPHIYVCSQKQMYSRINQKCKISRDEFNNMPACFRGTKECSRIDSCAKDIPNELRDWFNCTIPGGRYDGVNPTCYSAIYGKKKIEGIKHDKEKLRWDLLPFDALQEVVKVYTFGAKKYGDNNWQQVTPKDRYVAALLRHFTAWRLGESRDEETGLYHLAHLCWNGLALLWFEIREAK